MLLREAVRSFDLERWLVERGADAGDSEWVLNCPACGKHNLAVNVERRVWHCWTCERYEMSVEGKRRAVQGAGGLVKLLALVDGIEPAQAIDQILAGAMFSYRDVGLIPAEELRSEFLNAVRNPDPVEPPEGWRPITAPIPFMEKRGITMEDVRVFGLGWCDSGRYAGRMIFPVWEGGRLLYFQARAMWDKRPGERYLKSLNPKAAPSKAVSSELLMNLDQARRYSRVAIVEGPTDLVRVGPDAVATFGKGISPAQIGRLMRAGVRAIDLMWDADAKDEMLEAAPLLQTLFDTRLIFLPHGDPGDHSRAYLSAARYQAAPAQMVSILRWV